MESSAHLIKIRAAFITILISFIVLALKFWAYYLSGSTALFSDALETIINVVTAIVGLFVIRYVARPKDEDHPYGHGKAEYFSAAFEGGLILFAAVAIAIEAISSFLRPTELKDIFQGLMFTLIATVLNLAMALYLKKVGQERKSIALQASSAHIMSDVATTVGVFGGLLLVKWTGWVWMDAAMALAISVHLFFVSWKILRTSIAGLTDEIDSGSLKSFAEALEKHRRPGVIDVHQVRSIRSGSFHHIDAHIVIPKFWDIASAHLFLDQFEDHVVETYPYDAEIAFHIDPCQRKYCTRCELEKCPVREFPFSALKKIEMKDLVKGPSDEL